MMADERTKEGVFDERATGRCSDGDEKTGRPTVMHSTPECSDFVNREFFGYLEWAKAGHCDRQNNHWWAETINKWADDLCGMLNAGAQQKGLE